MARHEGTDGTVGTRAENDGAHSRKLLDDVLRAASEFSIIATDAQGIVTVFNRGSELMLGYTADEIVGRHTPLFFHDEAEVAARGTALSAELGYPVEGFRVFAAKPEREGAEAREWTYVRKDGSRLLVSLVMTPIRSEHGEITGYLGIAHDITELKQTEDKFAKIFLTTPDCVAITRLSDGMIVEVNNGFEDITGWQRSEAVGKTAFEISFWADPRERGQMVEDLSAGRDIRNREFHFRRKDGTVRHGTFSARTMQLAGEAHLIFVLQDVTQLKETEGILRENEERLRGITTNVPGVVFQFYATNDGAWVISYVSEYIEEFLGRTAAPLEDRMASFIAHMHADDRDRFLASIQQVVERCEPWSFEGRYLKPSGETMWFQALSTPSRHADRIVFNGLLLDITERKHAEEALRASEDRYRAIFEKSATANAIIAEDTTILLANSNFEKLVGYAKEEMEGKMSWTDFVVEEYLAQMKDYHFQRRAEPDIPPQTYVFKGRIRSGEIRDFYTSVAMIPGTRESIISLIDITERIRAVEALRQSEDRYRTIFEKSATANVILAEDTTILLVNSNFEKLVGYTREEVEGKMSWTTLVQPEYLAMMQHYNQLRGTDHDAIPFTYEFKVKTRSGEVKDLSVSVALIPGTSERIVTLIDITEQKRLEESRRKLEQQLFQSQKMEAMGVMAGGIAHDFNNILSGIFGYAELALRTTGLPDKAVTYTNGILHAAERARELVLQILTFSRQTELELRPIMLKYVLKEALKLIQASTPASIEIQAALKSNAVVMAEPSQLHQMIINLCTNAVYAMQDRNGILEISLEDKDVDEEFARLHPGITPGRHVRMRVSDTGCGIEPAVLEHIFDPFFTTKPQREGTGLGLSVVHGIVKKMQGIITVASAPGKGTSFEVILPVTEQEAREGAPQAKDIVGGSERVLLVDDEESIRMVFSEILANLGYRVTVCGEAHTALAAIRNDPQAYDVIITDYSMPQMNGLDLAREIKTIRRDIPIILSSGFLDEAKTELSLQDGIREILRKPVSSYEIARALRKALDG